MRVEFLQSIDFNQTLVYSTFAHLLALTIVMFLPSPRLQEQIVVPIFRLDLIELPSAVKPTSKPGKEQKVVAPPVKKRRVLKAKPIANKLERQKIKTPVSKPRVKQLPPPKPILRESEARKKILADLETLGNSAKKKSILEELDQVARLAPEARAKKIVPPKPMQEETFKEIEKKRTPEFPLKPEQAEVPPLIEDFEADAVERELTKLLEQPMKLDSKKENKTTSDLIKELEAINKKTLPADVPVEKKQLAKLDSIPASNEPRGKSLESVAVKFEELEDFPVEIKIDISQGQMVLKDFKSEIQRVEAPAPETAETHAFSAHEGSPSADALSIYIGKIYKRVYSKWKTPLGSKAKSVVVAFTIFQKGNINEPVIRESAKDENLDSIAVRAILDSVPFPSLPEELHRLNLRVSIIFKYVLEKK